ncbi:hypothetical protein RhiirA4_482774 [Rhizophagus irregularis]|uniref:Uncharacterized protein n=1 Tax=Rhizophagus irregularis TaxID=588596 RepID=A0A2I1HLL8_9GLOM|nr:hypothetical protein RhiirA4_482774 [Rhizophagus irregularis]
MSFKWYTALVMQDSNNRKAFKRTNGSWIVVDYSCGLRVLDLYNKLKAFDFTSEGVDHSLIPLLPGYIVFTSAGKKRFKLSILESNNQLLFYWEEFGSDTSYKYGLVTTNSIQYVLGLNIPEIINKLKQLVYEKFAIISQVQELENSKLIRAKKKEETLRRSLKRDQEKIDEIIYENNENRENIILH